MTQNLLILGGTHFVGWAVAEQAVRDGWVVTVFHRGNSPAPAGVREVLGDRTLPNGLATLGDAPDDWDLVVDTWSAAPRVVRESAKTLTERAERYAYISSASVYQMPFPAGSDESRPLVPADPGADVVQYPQDKAGAEAAVLESFGDRALLLRPGMILGPREDVGRLPWWLNRIHRGGDVLAPGPRDLGIQFIDARDLAAFALCDGLCGAYDVVSPVGHATIGGLLDACVEVVRGGPEPATLRWVSPDVIEAAGIEPWTQLPAWLPPGEDHDSLFGMDVRRAIGAGLTCRPVIDTVRDTWAWLSTLGEPLPHRPSVGLDPDVEAAVLAQLP